MNRIITGPELDAPATCQALENHGAAQTRCTATGDHLASVRMNREWRVLSFCGPHILAVIVQDRPEVEVL